MERQKVFTTVKEHLLRQGKQSKGGRAHPAGMSECRYRAKQSDGTVLRCAVGCLIPDEMYKPTMEGTNVIDLLRVYAQVAALFDVKPATSSGYLLTVDEEQDAKTDMGLLFRLQCVHDQEEPDRWPDELRKLACDAGLEY